MKINVFETHDRLKYLMENQANQIFQGAEDCLRKNEDSLFYQSRSHYIYLFAHPRTQDDGINKRMLWQPRLMKPEAQTNSYLFRAQSKSDIIQICWLLPPEALWPQYKLGNVTESDDVLWSINQFKENKSKLELPESDDLSEERCKKIMKELIDNKRTDRLMKRAYYQF